MLLRQVSGQAGQQDVQVERRFEALTAKTIEKVLEEHTNAWMAVPGVVGTGIGLSEGRPCIKVYVVEQTPELAAKIPATVDGYRVILEVTGEIRALDR